MGWLVLIMLRKRATGGQKCAGKKYRYEILKLVSDLRVWIKTVSFGNSILVWFQATNPWDARKFKQQFFWDFVKRRLSSIFHSQLFCVLLYIDGLSYRPGIFQLFYVNCSLYIVKNFSCWTGLIYFCKFNILFTRELVSRFEAFQPKSVILYCVMLWQCIRVIEGLASYRKNQLSNNFIVPFFSVFYFHLPHWSIFHF